jgi:Protein of unknown function (DUF3134)
MDIGIPKEFDFPKIVGDLDRFCLDLATIKVYLTNFGWGMVENLPRALGIPVRYDGTLFASTTVVMNNPSLRSQPREQHAVILKSSTDASILSWLEGTGRLMERDIPVDPRLLEEDDELSGALMGTDDIDYDDDIDDDSED